MILAIETSTPEASLALLEQGSGEVLWQSAFESDRLHNAKIFAPVEQALEICRGKLQQIVVGLGPGSYSGVRVGISVANGLSLALEVPVMGLASIATLSDEMEFVVTGDARRSSYYLAHIHKHRLESEPELLDKTQWLDEMAALREKGLNIYTTEKSVAAQEECEIVLKQPKALELAREVAGMEKAELDERVEQTLQPIYLRAPYITQPK